MEVVLSTGDNNKQDFSPLQGEQNGVSKGSGREVVSNIFPKKKNIASPLGPRLYAGIYCMLYR